MTTESETLPKMNTRKDKAYRAVDRIARIVQSEYPRWVPKKWRVTGDDVNVILFYDCDFVQSNTKTYLDKFDASGCLVCTPDYHALLFDILVGSRIFIEVGKLDDPMHANRFADRIVREMEKYAKREAMPGSWFLEDENGCLEVSES